MTRLPVCYGTYALVLLAQRREGITVGRLGELDLERGWYVYVGSAWGSGGLRARVSRHARREKTYRWHVDYVRAVTDLLEVWLTCDATRRECQWSDVLQRLPFSSIPLEGCGSSDCRCPAHLHFFRQQPSVAALRRRLRHAAPDHEHIRCVSMT